MPEPTAPPVHVSKLPDNLVDALNVCNGFAAAGCGREGVRALALDVLKQYVPDLAKVIRG